MTRNAYGVSPWTLRENAELDGPWMIDWAGSQRWYRGQASLIAGALARAAGGQVSLFQGGDRTGEVMHGQRGPENHTARVKKSFDPDASSTPVASTAGCNYANESGSTLRNAPKARKPKRFSGLCALQPAATCPTYETERRQTPVAASI